MFFAGLAVNNNKVVNCSKSPQSWKTRKSAVQDCMQVHYFRHISLLMKKTVNRKMLQSLPIAKSYAGRQNANAWVPACCTHGKKGKRWKPCSAHLAALAPHRVRSAGRRTRLQLEPMQCFSVGRHTRLPLKVVVFFTSQGTTFDSAEDADRVEAQEQQKQGCFYRCVMQPPYVVSSLAISCMQALLARKAL